MQRLFCLLLSLAPLIACASPGSNASDRSQYTIAFSSCLAQNLDTSLWNVIADAKPQLFLFTGDVVYADTLDLAVKRRAFAQLKADKNFRNFRAKARVLAVWDDHDYGYNDAGGSYSKKKQMQKIFLDAFDEPLDSPRRRQQGIYTVEYQKVGDKIIQIIVLDVRYFRTDWSYGPKIPPYSRTYAEDNRETSTMLGETQWQWLHGLTEQPADLRILVSSTPVLSDDYRGERWGAFPRERDRLYRLLSGTKTGKWLIITGDRHFAQISLKNDLLSYPLVELLASGMNTVWEDGSKEPDRYRVGESLSDYNYGILRIDARRSTAFYSLHGSDGKQAMAGRLSF